MLALCQNRSEKMNGYNVTVYEPKDMRNHPVWRLLGGRTIAFRKVHVDLTGSVTAALMLAQALYWSEHTRDKAGWFYKSATEWTEETGLSVQEQRTARKKLNQFEWWQEEKRMTNGSMTYWFRVNPDKFIQHAIQQLESSNMQNQQLVDDTNMQNQQLGGGATVGSNSSITLDVITQDEQPHQSEGDAADFALSVIREHYKVLPRFRSHVDQEMWLDDHVELITEYGRDAYAEAVARCKASGMFDGKKAEHVERKIETPEHADTEQPKMQAVLLEDA